MTREAYCPDTGAIVAWDLIQEGGREHEAAAILLEASPEPPWRVLAICGIRVSTWLVDHEAGPPSRVERLPSESWNFRVFARDYPCSY